MSTYRGHVCDLAPKSVTNGIYTNPTLEEKVTEVIEKGKGRPALEKLTIERCGKSRIPLNGLVQDLHRANVYALYDELVGIEE